MRHREKITWMKQWAKKYGLRLELMGTCGFDRYCVGVMYLGLYPVYEWYDKDYNRIDNNGDVWKPEDAYHKNPEVAVLGLGKGAEADLYEWLKWFDDNGFIVEIKELPLLFPFPWHRRSPAYFVRMVRNKT